MSNPSPYFCAMIQIYTVMGFYMKRSELPLRFLKGDTVSFYVYFKQTSNDPLNTDGITATMTVGSQTIVGIPQNHALGHWLFNAGKADTEALAAAIQDVSFVLTKTATSDSTFIRIPNAVEAISII